MYFLIMVVALAIGLSLATVLYAIDAALATAPSLVLMYSLRFSLKLLISLYDSDSVTFFLTLQGINLLNWNLGFSSVASILVSVNAVLVYYGISSCIFSISYLVQCFCCLTFWYLFLTWVSSSGKVCCHADLINPKNLFQFLFYSAKRNWFPLESVRIPLNTDVVILIYFLLIMYNWYLKILIQVFFRQIIFF